MTPMITINRSQKIISYWISSVYYLHSLRKQVFKCYRACTVFHLFYYYDAIIFNNCICILIKTIIVLLMIIVTGIVW